MRCVPILEEELSELSADADTRGTFLHAFLELLHQALHLPIRGRMVWRGQLMLHPVRSTEVRKLFRPELRSIVADNCASDQNLR